MGLPDITFKTWLQDQIHHLLPKNNPTAFVIWCDPDRAWGEILETGLAGLDVKLWTGETHELALRNQFFSEQPCQRVIWLPVALEDIGYFQVYALQAEMVVQLTIAEALDEFGVDLPVDQIQTLGPILPAHALQWIDYPLSVWKEKFSVGEVKVSLVDDETILAILASPGKSLADLITPDRLSILNRRLVDDFGLPALYEGQAPTDISTIEIESWRVRSLAFMLVTEADGAVLANLTGDPEKVIHNQVARERTLKMLLLWQNTFDRIDAFEHLAAKADGLTTLQYWSKNLAGLPKPLSSPAVETIRFQIEVENLARLESFEELAEYMSHRIDSYRDHAKGFWGKRAKKRVGWADLVNLAESCLTLKQQAGVEKRWKTLPDATTWFVDIGWRVDWIGEQLFKENENIPGALIGVRAKLRQAYLRHLDRVNTIFADLISNSTVNRQLPFPYEYVGEQLAKVTHSESPPKQPTAIIITDACRYDIGCRLVEVINQNEPTRRAEVTPARAAVPTITPLGMTFALPGIAQQVRIQLIDNLAQPWLITAEHFAGNLAEAAQRREWLKQNFKIKDQAFLNIDQVLNSDSPETISSKTLGRLVFVFGDELDDHDGVLKPFGLDGVIDRYAALIRRLQSAGFNTIFLVTDHGFFHWEPAADEKDGPKPDGDILWKSRRAIVGRNLKHNTAIQVAVPNSDLDCCVPRSVNSFKTYGGLGFFHGGLTLQEWIIPFVSVRFPQKGQKIGGVLKPVAQITSLAQRIQVEQAAQLDIFSGQANENYLSRAVIIKVIQLDTGKVVFKSKTQFIIEPGGKVDTIELVVVPGASAPLKSTLEMRLLDADDEEILDRRTVTLQVELDDWA